MPGEGGLDPAEEPVTRAERLFASLTDQAERRPRDEPLQPGPPPAAEASAEPEPPPPATPGPLTEPQLREFLLSARDAIERIVKVLRAVRSQASATAGDLASLGEAVEQALTATNARLDALEDRLLGGSGPDAEDAEQALAWLRHSLRGSRGSGGVGPPAAP